MLEYRSPQVIKHNDDPHENYLVCHRDGLPLLASLKLTFSLHMILLVVAGYHDSYNSHT